MKHLTYVANQSSKLKIAKNRSLLKEYKTSTDDRVVYLKDNDEFQLQLFNPTSEVLGCRISINGKVLQNLLVLRPGERVWLERFLDDNKKFKFSTYEIDNSYETKKAIEHNGEIVVEFFKERKNQQIFVTPQSLNEIKIYQYPWNPNNSSITWQNYDHITCENKSTNLTTSVSDIPITSAYCTSLSAELNTTSYDISASTSEVYDTIETGRIEKGSYSSQQFSNVDYDFEIYCSYKETIKILPISQKQYSKNDIEKRYCTNCGKRLTPKYKFCPQCGTKVE